MPVAIDKRTARLVAKDVAFGAELKALKGKILSLQKKGTADVFRLGDYLSEARRLLKGHFGSWIKTECGINPRTALGYRRVASELKSHRDLLIARQVQPTVLLKLAVRPELRQEALTRIKAGERLLVKDLSGPSSHTPSHTSATSRGSRLSAAARSIARTLSALEQEVDDVITNPWMDSRSATDSADRMIALAERLEGLGRFLCEEQDGTRWQRLASLLRKGAASRREGKAVWYGRSKAATVLERASRFSGDKSVVEPGYLSWDSLWDMRHPGLKVLELCSGAGGLASGLRRAGFETAGLVEQNAAACKTLTANFPEASILHSDIREADLSAFEGIDLLAAGLPCPPFSQTGQKLGRHDPRNLFPAAIDIAKKLRPRAILFENVPGLMQSRHTTLRAEIISDLESVNYSAQWIELSSQDFGVPQRRKRLFLVAFRDEAAQQRFRVPTRSDGNFEFKCTVYDVIAKELMSKGWRPSEEAVRRLKCLAPTLIGGSEKKQGMDLGMPKSRTRWEMMGVDPLGFANEPPAADHQGPIRLTLSMLAAIQDFSPRWQFFGERQEVFRQITNAVPSIVGAYIGAAVRIALTGEETTPGTVLHLLRWYSEQRRREMQYGDLPEDWEDDYSVPTAAE